MSAATNRQIRLAARPVGLPGPSDWEHATEPAPEPGDGEILVAVTHISLDPAMRGWMNDVRSYVPPVGIGEVMRALALGEVVESRHDAFAVGDHVVGTFGAQELAVSDGAGVMKADLSLAPAATHLGALGMTGLTAYFGLLELGRPQPGETVVVSGAAGAVGSVVGQIARIKGARVVGITGGEEKCGHVVEDLGFDASINYKAPGAVRAGLRELCPKGVDVYFDNVGGEVLDEVLARLAMHARIVLCGAISQYNATEGVQGPANYMQLLVRRATMAGFLVFDYADRYAEGVAELAGWLRDGRLKAAETVVHGTVDDFPETFLKLFAGENTGKLVLQIAD